MEETRKLVALVEDMMIDESKRFIALASSGRTFPSRSGTTPTKKCSV